MKNNWKVLLTLAVIVWVMASSQTALVTLAQDDVIWTAQYYNNPYLSEPATATQQDMAIAFDWGASAPLQEMNVDNFSIRWSANPYFAEGMYRFYMLADDNVYLRIDMPTQPQIDTFNTPSVGQLIVVDVYMVAGTHHIQVDYREVTGDAFVYMTWENLATDPVGPNFPIPQQLPYVSSPWLGQYYPNTELSGTPVLTLTENTPSHHWGLRSPGTNLPVDNFSARWTSVELMNAGNYQMSVRADDGMRVYIDGTIYLDLWDGAPGVIYTAIINMTAGQHSIQVDYYEAGGLAFLDFSLTPTFTTAPLVYPEPVVTGTVIIASWLNVRSEPDANSNILIEIRNNEIYPVIGKNVDQSWWQINVNGTIGWVYWRFLRVTNSQLVSTVSTTTSPSLNQPIVTGYYVTTRAIVNLNSSPGVNYAILAQVDSGVQLPLVGRTADNIWWQVNFNSITGWVRSHFMFLPDDIVWNAVPVTGYYPAPVYTNVRVR